MALQTKPFIVIALALIASLPGQCAFGEASNAAKSQIAQWRASVSNANCTINSRICFWGKIATLGSGVYRAQEAACDVNNNDCTKQFQDTVAEVEDNRSTTNQDRMKFMQRIAPLPPRAQSKPACGAADAACRLIFKQIAADLKTDAQRIRREVKGSAPSFSIASWNVRISYLIGKAVWAFCQRARILI
jgi:hypothetical protein